MHAPRHGRRRRDLQVRAVLLTLLLAVTACGTGTSPSTVGAGSPELHIGDAQSSAPISGASQLVMVIENRGDGDDRLLGVDTDAALAIEIHRTEIDADGRASMRPLEDVPLPAGETVRFRPGGLHLMVVVPNEQVVVGGTFEVTLRFERSAPITRTVTVVDLLDLVETTGNAGG